MQNFRVFLMLTAKSNRLLVIKALSSVLSILPGLFSAAAITLFPNFKEFWISFPYLTASSTLGPTPMTGVHWHFDNLSDTNNKKLHIFSVTEKT